MDDTTAPADGEGAVDEIDPEAVQLGQRVEYLFEHVQPLGRRFTLQEVVDGIRAQGGPNAPKLSVGRLWALVKGKASNPTISTLRALGDFFGVPQAYFIDDDVAARVSAQLSLISAMRANDVRSVALRAATVATMSSQGLDIVRSLVEQGGPSEQPATGEPERFV
ncbi:MULTISPECIES: hypothetical protein [Kitasatospora]|uniref:HTH cro/C1-type domain-containing protein n=1 Tax=Kitasatospora cathayae TaxID=3004092 RepID=A0ABY7PXX3_9ACTN|nr:hypothetical protein [Kitasatospora sp. HUAS 3-15]WBP85214.1 hypothetical protein O1G21_04660 [Kitasatospora sp. HUAS 3-15]